MHAEYVRNYYHYHTEQVDGETAIMLAANGLPADLQRCGLYKLKSCAKFRTLFSFTAPAPCSNAGESSVAASSMGQDRKLSLLEVRSLRAEERRTYDVS